MNSKIMSLDMYMTVQRNIFIITLHIIQCKINSTSNSVTGRTQEIGVLYMKFMYDTSVYMCVCLHLHVHCIFQRNVC